MMNSPRVSMSDNTPSPITEAETSDDVKQWNKTSIEKGSTSVNSSKMESLPLSPSHLQKNFMRQNGMCTRKKLKMDDDEYESLEMACNLSSDMNDDCDAFGKHVAAQLRLMSKMQKFMAQRLISEICFRGQIQHLSLSTNVVNSPPHNQQAQQSFQQQQQQQQQHQPQQQQQQTPQSHLQGTLFAGRPPHMATTMFGRSPDYLLLHQQGLRSSTAIPSFQGFVPPQNDHQSVPLEQI